MKKITIKIVTSSATDWYALRVGQTFEVYTWGDGYVVAEDYDLNTKVWRHFDKGDVRIISEES